MATCYILVGCPGSGKTTFINQNYYDFPAAEDGELPIISGTDKYIERIAEALELTYSEVFKDAYKLAEKLFWDDIVVAANERLDIIIDRTSMSRGSRHKFFSALRATHRMEAIVFPVPEDLKVRLDNRHGKHIPQNVVNNMINSFEMPSMSEGFDAVWDVKSFVESLQ